MNVSEHHPGTWYSILLQTFPAVNSLIDTQVCK